MDSYRHLMLTPDSARRADLATDLALDIVAAGGWRALTPQTLAARAGCSRRAVSQWFGGQDELRRIVARCFGSRWQRWVEVRAHLCGPVGLLPDCEEVLGWCRFWMAMVEAGPRDSRVAEVVAACRYTERVEVARILGVDPDSDRAGAVLAVIEGLRVQLCAAEVEISLDDAHRILLAAAEGPHFSLA